MTLSIADSALYEIYLMATNFVNAFLEVLTIPQQHETYRTLVHVYNVQHK